MNIDVDSKMNSKLSPKNDLYRVDNESGFTEVGISCSFMLD
jgi:hypothetical protein